MSLTCAQRLWIIKRNLGIEKEIYRLVSSMIEISWENAEAKNKDFDSLWFQFELPQNLLGVRE